MYSCKIQFLLLIIFLGIPSLTMARPEKIEPGVSYYSDDFVLDGQIYDLAAEKNYEEVYQFFSYYEATYDEMQRVLTFREYKRNKLIRTEEYTYGVTGKLIKKEVTHAGHATEVIRFDQDQPLPAE